MQTVEILFSIIITLLSLIQASFWNWKKTIDTKINDFEEYKSKSFETNSEKFVLRHECYKEHLSLTKYNDEKFSRIENELLEIKKILLQIKEK